MTPAKNFGQEFERQIIYLIRIPVLISEGNTPCFHHAVLMGKCVLIWLKGLGFGIRELGLFWFTAHDYRAIKLEPVTEPDTPNLKA